MKLAYRLQKMYENHIAFGRYKINTAHKKKSANTICVKREKINYFKSQVLLCVSLS